MANDHEELVALFRYSVISEAVGARLSPTERGLVVRALASRSWRAGGRGALLLAQHAR